jgi:Uma2 family endonuclease
MRNRSEILAEISHSPEIALLANDIHEIISRERSERERFYNLIHENVKAEFINGEIVFHSPVRAKHWIISSNIMIELGGYVKKNKLGLVGAEKVMIRLTRNDYEPDIVFFKNEKANQFTADQLIFPVPDFVIEILSPSTEKYDRGDKLLDYAAHGVSEYWIIDPETETVEKYLKQNDYFKLFEKLHHGTVYSDVIAGFEIELKAIFAA